MTTGMTGTGLPRMGVPMPNVSRVRRASPEGAGYHLQGHRSPAATILRAKFVLTAIALAAAVALVAVAPWPLKVLVVLAFVRGLFASDLVAFRNARRRRGSDPTGEPALAVQGDGGPSEPSRRSGPSP